MVLKKGDFVRIDYIGRIKESDEVFDTTIEKVAREKGLYKEDIKFKVAPIVVGANHVLKGLDEALVGLEVGEKSRVEVPPEKGYGMRDPKLVKVIPVKDFRAQGIKPVPGMRVTLEDKVGRVQSVGGGRVRVDFNHGLAGKVLEYEVTIKEKANKIEEKLRLLLELHFPFAEPNDHEIALQGDKAMITLSDITKLKNESLLGKHLFAKDAFEYLDSIKEIEFKEVFKSPKTEPKSRNKKGKTQKKKES